MRKTITRLIALCSAAASIALAGCGSSGSGTATSTATLSGVAATGAPIIGTAYIKDSSTPARELSAPTGSDGSYSFNVEGMTPPFIVKVNWGTQSLMSFATTHGTANVTPLTHVIVANAAGVTDPASLYSGFTPATQQQMAASIAGATTALQTRLKPLFDLYGVTTNPLTGTFVANHTGLDAMLDAVSVTISSGNMVVTNKTTNATICTAPIQNMTAGTFTMGNMPTIGQVPPAATLDGAALYGSKCASCHGVLVSSNKKGATVARIQTAITNNVGSMGFLTSLTPAEVQSIASALGASAPMTPSTPAPTPSPTPAPTPAPVNGATLYANECAGCHGALASSTKRGITLARLQSSISSDAGGMGYLSSLTAAELQAIVNALAPTSPTPAPTPAPTPTPTPTPTPAPTPTPTPVDGATLYANECAGCHGTLASSAKKGATAAQIQVRMAAPPYTSRVLTTTEVQAIASALAVSTPTPAPTPTPTPTPAPTPSCGSCHAVPPATGEHSLHSSRYSCATCHGTGYSKTTVNSTTHSNGVLNLVSTIGWNATTSSCANSCHGSQRW